MGCVWRVGEGLETGIAGMNTDIISTDVAQFRADNESGGGREGSMHGIHDFLAVKYICSGGV